MNLTGFAEALKPLGADAAFRIANAARPPRSYLFATLLPEMLKNSYYVESGTMTVRATMAGLAGMDSPYPPGGAIELSTFMEQSAKIANQISLSEKAIRDLQGMVAQLQLAGRATTDVVQREALNFLQKVVIQAHLDTMEWLRGQCLALGAINWTFGGKQLSVDYGIPTAHKFANRTGTAAYGGSASVFWADQREAKRLLSHNVRAAIAHPDTIDEIVYNDANALEVIGQDNGTFTIQRLKTISGNTVQSRDARDTIQLIAYDGEGDILDLATPGETVQVPFMPRGKIVFVGEERRSGYRVGEGSTDDPLMDQALGYTHIGPTVEGGGRAGRWADLGTPDNAPWQLRGRGVTNGLPVLESPKKVVILSTDL